MTTRPTSDKIAIVGMGCVFPDAANPDEFWQNILAKRVSIAKVSDDPEGSRIFDVDAHYRPELHGAADKKDKSYTDLSGLVRDFRFDPRKYRIPPTVAEHMDDNQKIALASADQALVGVSLDGIPREKISVFVGSSMIGERHHEFQQRVDFQRFEHHLERHPDFRDAIPSDRRETLLRDLEKRTSPRGRPVTEDTAPGILPNIIAARIASVFDFHGHAYTIDAACASGLAAIICGMQHLVSGESDLVLCGAADMLAGEIGRIYFSGIGALSPDGSYPFDERANGFVIGQGGGIVALKRLSDALRDGDTVHAVVAGYGQTSDGKGKAIAAPNPVWQAKTIERALEMAGFHPDSIELIEAHGTATKVGDASEIEALKTSFAKLGATRRGHCAVGSVKSNIGHLKSAAGIAGVIKTIQALRHKTLPPTANCVKVNPKLELDGSPFRIVVEPGQWEPKSHTRRAGVSAFGFGGANYHLVLEEFDPNTHRVATPAKATTEEQTLPSDRLAELALFSGSNRGEVASRIDALLAKASRTPNALSNLALEESYRSDSTDEFRLAVVFESQEDLRTKVSLWKQTDSDQAAKLLRAKGIFQGQGATRSLDQTAFLFPGQGSQYPDMMLELQDLFPSTRRIASRIDAWWEKHAGTKVSDLVSSRSRGKEKTEALLKDTRNTHPALLHANMVGASLLQDMGVRPAWMIGHSAGEVVALAASGKLDLSDALHVMDRRSRAFIEMDTTDFGKMAAVRCDRKRLEELVSASGLPVAIANINSPEQIIASGPSDAIDAFCALLDREGVKRASLNVSHAFHSPVVAPAAASFGKALRGIRFHRGQARVIANEIRAEYPESDEAIRTLLESQVTGSVDFCGGVEELYQQGVRVFVEVGPGSVLGNLAQSILKDRDATIVSINHRNGDTLESLQKALAALFAEGIALQPIPPARRSPGPSVESGSRSAPAPALPAAKDQTRRIVYSGVSVGLPGSFRKGFQDDNFDRLFEGQNCIEQLSDADKSRLAELRVTKVEKTAQGPVFQVLETLEDVIQLAGKIGKIDPLADYALDPKETETATSAILHAVAAGYEALRDAHIPLVREYTRTASGSLLPDRWTLPQEMQKRTGVIFAHGFPMVEPVAAEVSRHLAHKYGGRLRAEIVELYQELVGKIHDQDAKSFLTEWFTRNHHQLSSAPGSQEVYAFNHRFIQQISALANNRLAAYVGALGPNFQINAACSSTCTSITLAEEMIRSGRADRFLVIGSDDPTSETTIPYLGAAFLSTGAATSEPDLYKAALPFDRRRNGMLMGAGAVGIVVEAAEHAHARAVKLQRDVVRN
ncbi:MAG TPA: beta-ketoacyl synthase N-terminal-like domain-containing protein, partial [Fibrobacteria bacterium]|nr:beta-ketoacyl synthase N-terminal-like domain-containing protein [Fibrobacteria bacterium]